MRRVSAALREASAVHLLCLNREITGDGEWYKRLFRKKNRFASERVLSVNVLELFLKYSPDFSVSGRVSKLLYLAWKSGHSNSGKWFSILARSRNQTRFQYTMGWDSTNSGSARHESPSLPRKEKRNCRQIKKTIYGFRNPVRRTVTVSLIILWMRKVYVYECFYYFFKLRLLNWLQWNW